MWGGSPTPYGSVEAARLAAGASGRVALIVHGRLGDALQWNGRYAEAQPEWLKAAEATTPPEPHLLATRTDALLRSGQLMAARESAYAGAARAREAGDRDSLRDALTFQAMTEIHLGLLREADASATELETAVGSFPSGDRVEALGLHAWVDALLHDEPTCQARIAAALAGAEETGFTPGQGMAAGLLARAAGGTTKRSQTSKPSFSACRRSRRRSRSDRSWTHWSRRA